MFNTGYEVAILDNFSPQIHGTHAELPAQLFRGDFRELSLCAAPWRALHLAASVLWPALKLWEKELQGPA